MYCTIGTASMLQKVVVRLLNDMVKVAFTIIASSDSRAAKESS